MARIKKVEEVLNNESNSQIVTEEKTVAKPARKTANKNNSNLEEENKQLRGELDELKAMMQQLLNDNVSSKTSEEPSNQSFYEIQDYEEIDLKKLINVTNLFDGEMTLYGINDTRFTFSGFGVTRPLTYENIIQIVGNYNKWAKAGLFYIHDAKAVKLQMLEEDYKNCLTKEQILNFIDNSESRIKEILPKLSSEIKDTLKYVIARGVNSDDRRYLDRNKLGIIGEILKIDLREFAEALRN